MNRPFINQTVVIGAIFPAAYCVQVYSYSGGQKYKLRFGEYTIIYTLFANLSRASPPHDENSRGRGNGSQDNCCPCAPQLCGLGGFPDTDCAGHKNKCVRFDNSVISYKAPRGPFTRSLKPTVVHIYIILGVHIPRPCTGTRLRVTRSGAVWWIDSGLTDRFTGRTPKVKRQSVLGII